MAFPVTLNGRTYTLADFEGTNYVDGLPDAFEDFVTQAGDIYNSTSTSSVAIGTGSKTFTVADSGKPYQAGTPLRIADAAAPSTNFMDAIVTSYSGTTLVVDVFGFAGSGTKSNWTINIGGAKTVDGTLAVAQGGTGATSASAAADNLGLGTSDAVTFGSASISGDLAVDTDTLFVDVSAGNVGIGTTNTDSHKAAIDSGAGTSLGLMHKSSNSFSLMTFKASGTTQDIRIGVTGNDLLFQTNATEAMRIDPSGNVGIGTTTPGSSFGGTQKGLVIADGTINAVYNTETANAIASVGTISSHGFTFKTAGSERMRIDSSGNVLFSATALPSTGAGGAAFENEGNFGRSILQLGQTENTSTLRTVVEFYAGSTRNGTIQVSNSSTSYNTSSDVRLKENIVDAPSASSDIDAIQIRSYDWKADGSHQKYGVVAQELVNVAPEAVSQGETEEDTWGVDYSKLVPMLVKEIQELRARVATLEGK